MKSEDPCAHLDKSTVLIVDDERANRLVLQDLLRCNRIESECVETGEEATAYLNSHSVDLILLDVNTDGMAELSLLRKLREAYSRTELSIVIITARSDSSYVVSALQHGANDYITTPIDSDEVLARVVTQLQMVQAQKALRASEERYSLAAKATNDGLWDWDLRKNEVYYSERWKSMLGIEETATLRSPADWFERIYQADRSRVESEFEDHLNGNSPHIETELRMLHADGTCRWMYCRGLAFRDESGMALRLAGSLSDVSARKVVDALTSLPNRMLFLDRITRSLDYSKRIGKEAFAVLFIDLDNFKLINDSLGHDVGDQLLIAIAERLESSVRSHETVVGRLGGDEFAVLIERIEDRAEAEVVAGRILKRICEPCLFGVNEIFPCASIGISFGKMQESAEEVIREADTAMYEAKSSGKARVSQFDPDMHREVTERLTLQNQLRKAVLSDDQLILHYQPIVNLQSGAIVGFEALMRWQHPENKLVSPGTFIPIAEETGLVVPIGKRAIECACRQIAEWSERFPQFSPFVSVNVSSRQLVEKELVETVKHIVRESGVPPSRLKLEVTESAIMDNPDDASYVMSCLREMGVKMGIDDFGTGYSSLACLHRLPLDLLKVDQSFVSKMLCSAENEAIVNTIIRLAESLNLDVIAEGIESEEEVVQLRALGCNYGQGFYFSKPVTFDGVLKLMEQASRIAEDDSQGNVTKFGNPFAEDAMASILDGSLISG